MKIKSSYLLLALLFSIAFQSCSKDEENAYAEWQQKNEKFIDEIKNDPSYLQATVPQGPGTVYYEIINKGQGDTCALYTSQVKIHYKGWLISDDHYVFDDSSERIATMDVNGTVSGFAVALQNMRRGDKWRIYIPWQLGYGSSGYSSSGTTIIPPYSTLIFEIELLQISKY